MASSPSSTRSISQTIELAEVTLQFYDSLRTSTSTTGSGSDSDDRSKLIAELQKYNETLSSLPPSTLRSRIRQEGDDEFVESIPENSQDFKSLMESHMTRMNMMTDRADLVMTKMTEVCGPGKYPATKRRESVKKKTKDTEYQHTRDLLKKDSATKSETTKTLTNLREALSLLDVDNVSNSYQYTTLLQPEDDDDDDVDFVHQKPPDDDDLDYLVQRLSDDEEVVHVPGPKSPAVSSKGKEDTKKKPAAAQQKTPAQAQQKTSQAQQKQPQQTKKAPPTKRQNSKK